MSLNANAAPFTPAAVTSEERRSLFMTFSNGAPLNNTEISYFFNRKYGHCVQQVYVHDQHSKLDPKFGRIVFKTKEMPACILCGRDAMKVMINNKPVWLKKYVARTLREKLNSCVSTIRSDA